MREEKGKIRIIWKYIRWRGVDDVSRYNNKYIFFFNVFKNLSNVLVGAAEFGYMFSNISKEKGGNNSVISLWSQCMNCLHLLRADDEAQLLAFAQSWWRGASSYSSQPQSWHFLFYNFVSSTRALYEHGCVILTLVYILTLKIVKCSQKFSPMALSVQLMSPTDQHVYLQLAYVAKQAGCRCGGLFRPCLCGHHEHLGMSSRYDSF